MKVLPGARFVARYDLPDKLAIRSSINYLQQGVTLDEKLDETVYLKAKAENKYTICGSP